MAFDKSVWLHIRTRFECGDGVRDLSRAFKVGASTISMRAKKEGWEQGKMEHAVLKKVNGINDVQKSTEKIEQIADKEQLPLIEQIVSEKLKLMHGITNLTKGAMNIHNMVLKGTFEKLKRKEIDEMDAARVVALQGLSVSSIAQMTGITEQNKNIPQDKEEAPEPIQFYLPDNGRGAKELS